VLEVNRENELCVHVLTPDYRGKKIINVANETLENVATFKYLRRQ
jgi:hypothetical protein